MFPRFWAAIVPLITASVITCSNAAAPIPSATRTYRLGFSATPPQLTIQSVLATIEAWRTHADIVQIT